MSFDEPAENRAFAEAEAFPYLLLSDVDRSVGRAYQVERDADDPRPDYPQRISYLIDPEGRVARSYAVTDAATHPDQVLSDLTELIGRSS